MCSANGFPRHRTLTDGITTALAFRSVHTKSSFVVPDTTLMYAFSLLVDLLVCCSFLSVATQFSFYLLHCTTHPLGNLVHPLSDHCQTHRIFGGSLAESPPLVLHHHLNCHRFFSTYTKLIFQLWVFWHACPSRMIVGMEGNAFATHFLTPKPFVKEAPILHDTETPPHVFFLCYPTS